MRAPKRKPVGVLVAWLGLLVGLLGAILAPAAHAANLTASDFFPQVFFSDTSLGGVQWEICTSCIAFNPDDFSIFDNQTGNFVVTLFSSGNNFNSLVVDTNGDVHLADGAVSVDRSTGRLGIGTSSPGGNIHVFGGVNADIFAGLGPDLINGPALNFGYSGSSFGRGSGFFNVRPDPLAGAPNPSIRFATANVQRMIITNTGNVGINNLNPTATLHVVGSALITGTKSFVQDHPTDPTKQIVYVSLEGPEAGTYIRGTAQLVTGEAVVELPEHFGAVTAEEGLTVQLTPQGEWLRLYVVKKSPTRLVVREADGKSGRFDYLVHGVRRGFEDHQVVRDKLSAVR